MAELLVGKSAELKDGQAYMVDHGDYGIGVYRKNGGYHAYLNHCPHQGGPACEGLMIAKVEEVLHEDKTYHGMTFNHDEMHIVCPWHGWEFLLESGQFAANKSVKLKSFEVVERDGEVFVVT